MEKRYSEITRRNAQIAQGTDIARCPTFQGWSQRIDATQALNLSAGVSNCKVSLQF
jgi:hypothetical protein